MSEEREERLRQDIIAAWSTRADVYVELLRVLKEEFGARKAKELFQRVTYKAGVRSYHRLLREGRPMPESLGEFAEWIVAIQPGLGELNGVDVVSRDEGKLTIKHHRCPLKEAWLKEGLSREEVRELCEVADCFSNGFFGRLFQYDMELWSEQPDEACVLHFKPKEKEAGKKE